ncbi:MAG: hypothetical protein LBG67_04090 [Campylobacteraceae bacterium]|jgi:hypothetical protein|nr:hypothetical protein [Campylobacteraceae bacterium]
MKKLILIFMIFTISNLFANSNRCEDIFSNATVMQSFRFDGFPYGQNATKIGSFTIYQNGYRRYFLETINNKALIDTRTMIEVKQYNNKEYVFVDFVPYIFGNPEIYKLNNDDFKPICNYQYQMQLKCKDCEDSALEKYVSEEHHKFSRIEDGFTMDIDNDGKIENLEYIDDISGGFCDYATYKITDTNKEVLSYIFEKYNLYIKKCFTKVSFFSFNNKNYIYIEDFNFNATVYLIDNGTIEKYSFELLNITYYLKDK